jgi:hypothetical protein
MGLGGQGVPIGASGNEILTGIVLGVLLTGLIGPPLTILLGALLALGGDVRRQRITGGALILLGIALPFFAVPVFGVFSDASCNGSDTIWDCNLVVEALMISGVISLICLIYGVFVMFEYAQSRPR